LNIGGTGGQQLWAGVDVDGGGGHGGIMSPEDYEQEQVRRLVEMLPAIVNTSVVIGLPVSTVLFLTVWTTIIGSSITEQSHIDN
jgi:hypothetical protein